MRRSMVDSSFEQWYRAEHPRLVGTLSVISGDRDVAADVAAEAFVRALERWDRVGSMERPGAWTYRVAVNLLRRRQRRAALENRLLARSIRSFPEPSAERDTEVWQAVAALPSKTRAAAALRFVADLTEPEIADVLGVRRGTVATSLKRARDRLAVELADPAPEPEVALP